jgi:steroid delta-isomerase-like uncharacterized protein
MSAQDNMATQERLANAVNTGHLDDLDEVFARNVVDHDPAPGQARGPEGFKQFFSGLRRSFPDLHLAAEHVDTTDDDIALAYTITGTHKGDFLGVAPTGKRISVRGMQIARFEGGKIAERWGSSDELGILKQLGVMSQYAAPPAPQP